MRVVRAASIVAAFGLGASCVEVVSLTRAVDAAAPADAAQCTRMPSDTWVSTLRLPDVSPCLAGGLRARACRLVVTVPAGESPATWCAAARGRAPLPGDASSCVVTIAPTYAATGVHAPDEHGFYIGQGTCVVLTDEPGGWRAGLQARLECTLVAVGSVDAPGCALRPLGAACTVGAPSTCVTNEPGSGCGEPAAPTLRASTSECASSLCLGAASADASLTGACACRCALAAGVTTSASPLCACPAGFACAGVFDHPMLPPDMRGRYCVPVR